MIEKSIKMTGIQEAVAKSGKTYWKIQTAEHGNMSCFEKKVAEELMKHLNENFNVVIAESNGFQNIRGIGKELPTTQNTEVIRPGEVNKIPAGTQSNIPEKPLESKKDPVRAMRLTEKFYEFNDRGPTKDDMLETYKYFLNNL